MSVEYRLLPAVDLGTIVRDVAKAVRWVHDHVSEYGGDPDRLVVMGHSAGAQLAALGCTDDRYLKAEKLSLDAKGVRAGGRGHVRRAGHHRVGRDPVAGPRPARDEVRPPGQFRQRPGQDKDFSAVTHVAKDKGVPPFLLLYVADHPDTTAQARRLGAVLKDAGVPVTLFGAKETTHTRIDTDLGLADDPATKAVFEFMGNALKK